MRVIKSTALALGTLIGASSAANATVITFDDISVAKGDYTKLSTYADLTWDNVYVENHIGGPFDTGIVSGSNAAFGGGANLGSFSSDKAFTFDSAYFTTGNYSGPVIVKGYDQFGAELYSDTFSVSNTYSQLKNFDWNDVYKVTFLGRNPPYAYIVIIDNIAINSIAAPEAATWAMMIVGFGAVGAAMRRRQRLHISFA